MMDREGAEVFFLFSQSIMKPAEIGINMNFVITYTLKCTKYGIIMQNLSVLSASERGINEMHES